MNQNVVPETAAIRFAGPMNYRIEGDVAHIEADLQICDPARAASANWKLQFWTEEGGPAIRIAEVPLGAVSAAQGAVIPVGGSALAALPAGDRAHRLALRLACDGPEGEEQHDFSAFAHAQHFQLPRLEGVVGYRFDGDQVEISAEGAENPREQSNLSGTLSFELWALPVAYQGGDFQGVPVAGIQIGALAGQESFAGMNFLLPAAKLPPGEWHMTLMLREWTPSGFVTRDYSRFAQTYRVEAPVKVPVPAAAEPAKAAPPVAAKPAKTTPPAKSGRAGGKPAKGKSAAGRKAAAAPAPVSVNKATVDELAALGGVSRALAQAIIAARPFAKLEELTRVKGLGDKMLAKLVPLLKL